MALTVAVIGALEKEMRRIYDALEDKRIAQEAGLTVASGRLGDLDVVATVAGMGTVNAAAATQHLISAHGAGTVIFSGIAGGLNPKLHIGDVVIGERLRYLDTDTALVAESAPGLEEFASDAGLVALAEHALAARGYAEIAEPAAEEADAAPAPGDGERLCFLRGTIATGDRFVSGSELKAAVVAATQADCVEMEGAAIAHVAAKNGARCLILRAISDNCDESYDALSSREFDLDEYARSASELVLAIVRNLSA